MINFIKKFMNRITINGITKSVSGKNISVKESLNSKVTVRVDEQIVYESDSCELKISFEGDLANLNATHVTINGNVMGDVDGTHIKVSGDIIGNVDSTHVTAHEIKGNVDAVHVTKK